MDFTKEDSLSEQSYQEKYSDACVVHRIYRDR